MEVDHTDLRILMLAWKMKSEEQGYFTVDEWRRGLKALRADTVSKLKKALPDLEKEVRRPSNFSDFYSYAFQYCLTEEKQKSIDIESICELLSLVLGSTFPAQVSLFVEYLKNQNDYKVVNMDQWMGFFRFCNEISFPSLSDYDPELAWPLILDNFVEWLREKKKIWYLSAIWFSAPCNPCTPLSKRNCWITKSDGCLGLVYCNQQDILFFCWLSFLMWILNINFCYFYF